MVGDRCSDVGAANAAGLRQAFLIGGTETAVCGGELFECWVAGRGGAVAGGAGIALRLRRKAVDDQSDRKSNADDVNDQLRGEGLG